MKRKRADKSKRKVKNSGNFFKNINWWILAACILVVFAVASVGSVFTSGNADSEWYKSIKPAITPPNFVFPIVWSILFLLIGISLYYTWINSIRKFWVIILFGINLALNILWSFIYFSMQNPFYALIELGLLWVSIILLMVFCFKKSRISGWIIVPYLLWVSFAAFLNFLSIK
jgi:tryptophan-rich sensory protein